MDTVSDILGLTHVAVSNVVQQIIVLKRQINTFRSVPMLLDSVREKLLRIRSSLSSLEVLVQFTTLESVFFGQIYAEIQGFESDFLAILHGVQNNSRNAWFFSSIRLCERLEAAKERLSAVDRSLCFVGMIGEIVTRKVEREFHSIEERLNGTDSSLHIMTKILNQTFSMSHPPEAQLNASVKQVLSMKNYGDSLLTRPCSGLLASEQYSQVYFVLGRSYYTGDSEEGKDYRRAARFLIAAFERGFTRAAYYLGKLHYKGDGLKKSYMKAFYYYSIGAERGHGKSMSERAWCHEFGHGTEINGELAIKWYEAGAKVGCAMGMRNLGYHFLHGSIHKQNWMKATKFLNEARATNEYRACFDLAHCYEHGIGVERDLDVMIELLREGYHSGEEMSTSYLAYCCEKGIGVERDVSHAASLYRELMNLGGLGKLYQPYLGICMIRGLGVEKSVHAGLKIIKTGLIKGIGCGYAVLGDCYRYGYGVRQDVSKAVRYYSLATSCIGGYRGIRDAHLALAEMFENGDGVVRNEERAAHHYLVAANKMSEFAQWKTGSMFLTGSGGVQVHQERAFFYFDLSARSGFVPAQRKAGELYMKGQGVQRDRSKAVVLLEEAVQRGDTEAKRLLLRARFSRMLLG